MTMLPTEILELIALCAQDKSVSTVLKPFISERVYKESFHATLHLQCGEYKIVMQIPRPIRKMLRADFIFTDSSIWPYVSIDTMAITYSIRFSQYNYMRIVIPTRYKSKYFSMNNCFDLLKSPETYLYEAVPSKLTIIKSKQEFFLSEKWDEKTMRVKCYFQITQEQSNLLEKETFDIQTPYCRITRNKEYTKIQTRQEEMTLSFYIPSEKFVFS